MKLPVAAACLMALSTPALAQSAPGDDVIQALDSQFSEVSRLLGSDGYSLASGPYIVGLDAGGRQRLTIPVERGVDYRIIGVCDGDCTDVDLRLFNGAGANLGEDVLEDDFPIVDLRGDRSAAIQVEVEMVSCSEEPCFAGVEVFWKR